MNETDPAAFAVFEEAHLGDAPDFEPPPRVDPVPVPVYRNGRVAAYAAVDATVAPRVLRYRWQLHNKGYAVRTTRLRGKQRRTFYLHREVYRLQLVGSEGPAPASVDHLNGCPLDCRLVNLDGVTLSDNTARKTNGHREGREPPPAFVGRVLSDADLPPY